MQVVVRILSMDRDRQVTNVSHEDGVVVAFENGAK